MSGALFTQRDRGAYVLCCLSRSAPEYGGRCSNDGLAEPMNRVRPASASEFVSGHVIRTAGSSVGVSFRVFVGSRYSLDGLVEPMIFVCTESK